MVGKGKPAKDFSAYLSKDPHVPSESLSTSKCLLLPISIAIANMVMLMILYHADCQETGKHHAHHHNKGVKT